MTKTILFEQLPPELFALFQKMTDEISELKRMIQEGEIGVAISEAEFNLLKGRVDTLENQMTTIQGALKDLSIDPAIVNDMGNKITSMLETIAELTSFDTNSAKALDVAVNRLTAIETKQVTLSANNLTLPSSTKENLQLVAIDDYLSTIVWSSSNPNIIAQNGVVKQPSATEGNMNVVLTATITYGSAETTKTFIVNVPAAEMTDEERLDVVAEAFDYSVFSGSQTDDGVYISTDQNLPREVDGVIVTWSSSNEGIITSDGVITRSPDGDETVFLTAVLSFSGAKVTKTFTIIVEQAEVIIPEPIDYTQMFAGFEVIPETNKLSVQTSFGTIDGDVLTTETLDARVSATTQEEADASYNIAVSFEGAKLGDFVITGDDLNNGKRLSDILGQDPALLSAHVSDDVHLWTIDFEPLAADKEIKVELLVDDTTLFEEVVIVPATTIDPEPEPTEPEDVEPPAEPEIGESEEPVTDPEQPGDTVEPEQPATEPEEGTEPETTA